MTTVAIADDHHLIRQALIELINRFEGFHVIFDAPDGGQFLAKFKENPVPDIALIDINMPILDGYKTTEFISQNYPTVKPIALSVDDNEESIIKMLRLGAKGYILKDTDTSDFNLALNEIKNRGYYHSDLVSNTLLKSLKPLNGQKQSFQLHFQAREEEFIHLACTELTYKEIADKMSVSPRTVDGYRESLFVKLDVKSRVGLVLFAIRNKIVII